MNDLIIYKDNYLIEASYKLTLDEQRLMLYCIGKLNPQDPVQKQEIIIDDFAKKYDLNINSAYEQVKKAIECIYERSIKVKDPNQVKEFRWIQSKTYFSNEGKAVIEFSNAVMPYLCQLESQFTKYQLKYVSNFKSAYSIRIYELLTQYRKIKSRIISIRDLRSALGVETKFSSWNDLKRYVIEKSIEEINLKSDLRASYKPIKKGRTFESIEFFIEIDSQIDFFEKQVIAKQHLENVKKLF